MDVRKIKSALADMMKPEDLFVVRVLVSACPGDDPTARECARELAALPFTPTEKLWTA